MATLVLLFIVFFNYSSSEFIDHDELTQAEQAKLMTLSQRSDINGYDMGYIMTQKAEFNILLLSLKRAFTPDSRETAIDPTAVINEEIEWSYHKERAETVTKWPLVAYLISALFCLVLSAVCHLFYVRNENISKILTYLDYWGICLLGLGTCYPYISFKYACGPFILWRYVFTSIITVLSAVCCWATVQKTLMAPEKRACLFMVFGLSCLIPFGLLFCWYDPLYTLPPQPGSYSIPFFIMIAGFVVYLNRIPEKWSSTGMFDTLGASHQIFHCIVLAGIAYTFKANWELYVERLKFQCPA